MIQIETSEFSSKGIRFAIVEGTFEVAHGFLYIIKNDLHEKLYGLVEDIFVEEDHRRKGYGNTLIQTIISEAKTQGCYKLIAQSRHSNTTIHKWYEKIGFKNHGLNFRMDF